MLYIDRYLPELDQYKMFITLKRYYKQVVINWYQTNVKSFSIGGSAPTLSSRIVADKAVFATEITTAATSANLLAGRNQQSSGGGNYWGYLLGGADNNDISQLTANKITYSTDVTAANTSAQLSSIRSGIVGAVNFTELYSYGGSLVANSNDRTESFKTVFSTDVTTIVASALNTGRATGMTVSSLIAAIYLGGYRNTPSFFTPQTIVDKMLFSTGVTSIDTSLALPAAKAQCNYGSINGPMGVCGYIAGARAPTAIRNWYKVNYSTDLTTTLAAVYPESLDAGSGHNSSQNGYTLGGYSDAVGTQVTTAYKLSFSTETLSTQYSMSKTVRNGQCSGVG